MSRPVVTASSSETIAAASNRMRENAVGSVVVVDIDRPIGILTERDLVRFAASGADSSATKVSEWMTSEPDVAAPADGVAGTFKNLADRGYRHIPVVENGKLEGIVSMRDLMKIAQIQPAGTLADEVPRGLKGVVVAETSIGDVRGEEGFFHYRQYDATDMATNRTLEEVWFLLLEGRLPSGEELAGFRQETSGYRPIPREVGAILPSLVNPRMKFVPLDALRSAYLLAASSLGFDPSLDCDRSTLRSQALRTVAVMPTLAAALYRSNKGMEPIEPRQDLNLAECYLYMLTGEDPEPEAARALEQYLILTADHGFNASTFTARVITSTGADLASAVAGAIGALSGPLHGGAPSRALDMLDEIGTPDRAADWITKKIQEGKRLMGFGHAVYRTDDPRSKILLSIAEQLSAPQLKFAKSVEADALRSLNELKPGRRLYTNVEFYAAIVLDAIGIPKEMFTPTFACSRVIGWTAHILEQATDNRIIRPSARYVGPDPKLLTNDAEDLPS
jgi:citrate synthase